MYQGLVLHIIRFISLLLVQGLIINDLPLGKNVYPMIYILFLLMLPIDTPHWMMMLTAFVYGLLIDSYSSTIGIHVSAAVFIAFIRPNILNILTPREGYEIGTSPGIYSLGLQWFLSYAGIMIFLHHLWFFFVEVYNFNAIGDTLLRTFLSSLASLFGVVLIQYLFYRSSKKL